MDIGDPFSHGKCKATQDSRLKEVKVHLTKTTKSSGKLSKAENFIDTGLDLK